MRLGNSKTGDMVENKERDFSSFFRSDTVSFLKLILKGPILV